MRLFLWARHKAEDKGPWPMLSVSRTSRVDFMRGVKETVCGGLGGSPLCSFSEYTVEYTKACPSPSHSRAHMSFLPVQLLADHQGHASQNLGLLNKIQCDPHCASVGPDALGKENKARGLGVIARGAGCHVPNRGLTGTL